jgi:hypothetical protein
MFDTLKERLKRKVVDSSKKIELDGEVVYIKKSNMPLIGGWGIVQPPVNEDNTWNIPNVLFGGKQNLFKLLGILFIMVLFFLGFNDLFAGCRHIAEEPCKYCAEYINNLNLQRINNYYDSEIANLSNVTQLLDSVIVKEVMVSE